MADHETQSLTPRRLETFAQRTLTTVRRLPPEQRDRIMTRLLESDPELRPVMRAYYVAVRLRKTTLRRDSVM